MFCTRCGAQNRDTSKFCSKCGNRLYIPNGGQAQSGPAQSGQSHNYQSQNSQSAAGQSNTGTAPAGDSAGRYTVYEKFSPTMGMGISFVITDRSLIVYNAEYLYSTMERITLINPPSALTNGVANTRANGKNLTLTFKSADAQRFMKMLEYANNQIDKAHGQETKYRYVIQSGPNAKVEVYDEFIIVYTMKSGLLSVVGNSMAGGANGSIVYFSNLDVFIDSPSQSIRFIINNTPFDIPMNDDNYRDAYAIVDFINQVKTSASEADSIYSTEEKWEPFVGQAREFQINDKVLMIPKEMDLFNSYHLKFRSLASECVDRVKAETTKVVSNLLTYCDVFPKKYDKYLEVMIKKAVDILVSEEVWTVTQESLTETHGSMYHLVRDDLNITLQSIELTSQNNQRAVASVTGLAPNLVGGGFGIAGAVKGIAKATAFNIIRDTAEKKLVNDAMKVNVAQQNELYGRINFDVLFHHVFLDYYHVVFTLAYLLKNAGKEIWAPSTENSARAGNIFQNLSNPAFPEAKKLEVFLSILQEDPYNEDYQRFMISQWGESEQTLAVKSYFGF